MEPQLAALNKVTVQPKYTSKQRTTCHRPIAKKEVQQKKFLCAAFTTGPLMKCRLQGHSNVRSYRLVTPESENTKTFYLQRVRFYGIDDWMTLRLSKCHDSSKSRAEVKSCDKLSHTPELGAK